MTILLAEAGPLHADVLAALHAACFAAAWDAKAMRELLTMPGKLAMIAEANEEPVGFVLARIAADEAEILTIGTLPSWRRHGVGRRLLQAAGQAAAQAGAARIFLEVAADDPAALALYKAAGYETVGRRRDYYGDGRHALVMARSLAD